MQHHDEHRDVFNAQAEALGGVRQDAPNPKYDRIVEAAMPGVGDAAAFVDLAATLEAAAGDTYLANVVRLDDPAARALMASVLGVEAQHVAVLRTVAALFTAGATRPGHRPDGRLPGAGGDRERRLSRAVRDARPRQPARGRGRAMTGVIPPLPLPPLPTAVTVPTPIATVSLPLPTVPLPTLPLPTVPLPTVPNPTPPGTVPATTTPTMHDRRAIRAKSVERAADNHGCDRPDERRAVDDAGIADDAGAVVDVVRSTDRLATDVHRVPRARRRHRRRRARRTVPSPTRPSPKRPSRRFSCRSPSASPESRPAPRRRRAGRCQAGTVGG